MSQLPPVLSNLRFPVIASPLFIISNPKLVIEQCKAGVVGSMPALNARPAAQLEDWLAEITETLAAHDRAHPESPAAPFAINQIVHRSNDRLEHDLQLCAKYKVPITITSLGALGIDAFTPIINFPQAAILGVGRIRREPTVGRRSRVRPRDRAERRAVRVRTVHATAPA